MAYLAKEDPDEEVGHCSTRCLRQRLRAQPDRGGTDAASSRAPQADRRPRFSQDHRAGLDLTARKG